ncbi:MAG: hypothetical protein QXZ66_04080 [Thermoproteota archaeon]
MEPDPGDLKERFLEGLSFSLLIVLLTNVFSFFLTIGSREDFSSPTPFLKEESSASTSLFAGHAAGEKPASGEGLPLLLSTPRENSTGQEYFQVQILYNIRIEG